LDNEHFSPLNQLYNNNLKDYLNSELYICTECIKYAYHSYFHQVRFTDKCFIHNCKLKNATEINKSILYSIHLDNLYAYKYEHDNKEIVKPMYVNVFKAPVLIQNGFKQLISKIQIYSSDNLLIRIIDSCKTKNIKYNVHMSQVLNRIFFNKQLSFEPILTTTKESIKQSYINCINAYEIEFRNKFHEYNEFVLIQYICFKTIEEVLSNFAENNILEVQSKLCNYMQIEEESRTIATALIFAYNISDSRDVYDCTGNNLMIHSSLHDVIHNSLDIKCIGDIIIDNDVDDIFYLNLFLYKKTLYNIYEQTKEQIAMEPNIKINIKFNYELPQYIITKNKDKIYKVYECRH
jgi:hypothetical protein